MKESPGLGIPPIIIEVVEAADESLFLTFAHLLAESSYSLECLSLFEATVRNFSIVRASQDSFGSSAIFFGLVKARGPRLSQPTLLEQTDVESVRFDFPRRRMLLSRTALLDRAADAVLAREFARLDLCRCDHAAVDKGD